MTLISLNILQRCGLANRFYFSFDNSFLTGYNRAMKKQIKFKKVLLDKGLRQKDVAKTASLSPWVLSNFVTGRWNLYPEEKERVAQAVGVPSGELFEE